MKFYGESQDGTNGDKDSTDNVRKAIKKDERDVHKTTKIAHAERKNKPTGLTFGIFMPTCRRKLFPDETNSTSVGYFDSCAPD